MVIRNESVQYAHKNSVAFSQLWYRTQYDCLPLSGVRGRFYKTIASFMRSQLFCPLFIMNKLISIAFFYEIDKRVGLRILWNWNLSNIFTYFQSQIKRFSFNFINFFRIRFIKTVLIFKWIPSKRFQILSFTNWQLWYWWVRSKYLL